MSKIVRIGLMALLSIGGAGAVQALDLRQEAPAAVSTPADPTSLAEPALEITEIPGKATTERLCSQCHSIELATSVRRNQDDWNGVIERMMAQGLTATDEELYEISDYLGQNFALEDVQPAEPAEAAES